MHFSGVPVEQSSSTRRKRILILGAAGRDFHNFNVAYRDDPSVEVIAFTAAQIPGIAGRRYPPELSGRYHPGGISIVGEEQLEELCRSANIDEVVFGYSDVPHTHVMHLASRALAGGADFSLLGPRRTMLQSSVPVIAISATRTGCGKSQIARWLSHRLRAAGRRAAVLRHPMPYGDLAAQKVQRFASKDDLHRARCTIEEREEYEPHIDVGNIVFAGVDYAAVLHAAESEADIVVWDGGNNDFPFVRPDLHIVVADALRPSHASEYHPGEAVARMADIIVVNKVNTASHKEIARAHEICRTLNPTAAILDAASQITLDPPTSISGKRVLVVEDGPTLTHGGMAFGAGLIAAQTGGAIVVDPRPYATPELAEIYASYPHLGPVLPAVGYSDSQTAALSRTIAATPVDLVVAATPIDLSALVAAKAPIVRARYDFTDSDGALGARVDRFLAKVG